MSASSSTLSITKCNIIGGDMRSEYSNFHLPILTIFSATNFNLNYHKRQSFFVYANAIIEEAEATTAAF
jgi:hypothetical protein